MWESKVEACLYMNRSHDRGLLQIPSSVSCAVMGLWLSNSGHGVEEVEQNSRGKDNEWM